MSSRIRSMRPGALISAFKVAALAATLLVVAVPRAAQSAPGSGPFSALQGTWSGSGAMKKSDGTSERIRCRSAYASTGTVSLRLGLRCASDAFNFDLAANVINDGGPISGNWSETTRNVNGTIQGRSEGNGRQVQAVIQSLLFNANLTMTTRGDRQSILILSPGTEFPEVSITLEKR